MAANIPRGIVAGKAMSKQGSTSWKLHGTDRPGHHLESKRTAEDDALNSKNAIAIVVIVLVLAGGAVALYRLDTGEGARTSQSIAAKTASD